MKEHKINIIKLWLQMFGKRDNETFNQTVTVGNITWNIWLQYSFHEYGDVILPYNSCSMGFKHLQNATLEDRTEEELDGIIAELKKIKKNY